MPRVISFIVLLAIILLVGAIFFQVMAQFFVPLFLACVLLVVFQPLHAWILKRFPNHPRLCALGTTILILLVVLLPLTWLGWNAYVELHSLFLSEKGELAIVEDLVAEPAPVAETIEPSQSLDDDLPSAEEPTPPQGELTEWFHETAQSMRDDIARVSGINFNDETLRRFVNSMLAKVGTTLLRGVQTILKVLVGLAIMVIAIYYFLSDGPGMIRTVMYLSPLDPAYEKELLERFGEVSRAVVVATLLSAAVQGALAGVGYALALPKSAPIFLLTLLTMVTAMVPFVGAAAVWICVCLWVYLYGEHVVDGQTAVGDPLTAIILAVYCTIVVSGIDNVIKPLILHGQSRLHPLLALLSILGGVQVLGPVGILVGPMLVSFLQALLHMLRRELDSFGGISPTQQLAPADSGEQSLPPAPSDKEARSGDGETAPRSEAASVVKAESSKDATTKSRTARTTKRKGRS